jgi:FAD/FMN-containing dehydrogenase
MKRATATLFLAVAALAAQPLSQSDRDFALSQLHASRKTFLDAITGLSPAQWRFKPAPDRWSIAECAEHAVLSEDFMFGRVHEILKGPATPDKKSAVSNDELMKSWLDRSQKAQATAATQPTGRWATPAKLAEQFKQRRERTLEYVRTTQDALRSHFADTGGQDAYQWLLAIAGHTERHVLQINEVKADPRYPK